jgi:large repetitive protein
MRFTRIVLLLALTAGLAGVAVPSASALTYLDSICVVETGGDVRVCPDAETGKAYSYQLLGREGCWPYVSFSLPNGQPPPGISLTSNGLFTGVPSAAGKYEFWVRMQDVLGGGGWCTDTKSTERVFRITVLQGLQIQQREGTLTPGQLTVPYSLQFTANGGTPTWTVSSGTLPAGLSLSSAGLLSGTPTAAGDYSFMVTAAAGSRSDAQTYSMSVVPKLVIGPTSNAAEVGMPYRFVPVATGGKAGYTWSVVGTLPAGLTADSATGAISGTPAAAGRLALKLTVKDSLGLTTTVDFPLTVAAQLLVTKSPLPLGKVGTAYHAALRATGGVTPRTWRILGGRPGLLPKGLHLNRRTGQISGTPTRAGTFRLRIQVTDKLGAHSALGVVLRVAG